MQPSYTFENWLNGEVCLLSSSSGFLLKGEKMPIKVRWAQIKKTDVIKIKNKQKEIFENCVKILHDKLIRQYNKDSKSTRSLGNLLDRLISKYEEILFGEVILNTPFVTLKTDNTVFEYNRYVDIKSYVAKNILLFKRNKYVFIHASNCKLYHSDFVYPEVEAEAYYRFLIWIKDKKLLIINQKETIINKKNWRDDVFIDEQHYNKGLEIISKLTDDKAEVSSHSFVYHVFKKNDFLKDIKQKVYMQFLAEEYDVKIKGTKISSKKPAYLIKRLERYFPDLNHY